MKPFNTIVLLLASGCLSLIALEASAQVTIGADITPVKGALLELKTQAADADNATTGEGGGGLGLPRVKLVSLTTLQPFIAPADPEGTAAELLKRAGLMVYNLTSDANFIPGVYVWDGAKWAQTGGGGLRYFYLPSCFITLSNPIGAANAKTYDLYAQYLAQFTKAGNTTFVTSNSAINRVPAPEDSKLYTRAELDYVITYYDTNVLGNVTVTNTGVLNFYIKTLDTTAASFVNVVFVVK